MSAPVVERPGTAVARPPGARVPSTRPERRRLRVARIVGWVVAVSVPLLFLAVFFGLPVATLILRGFQPDPLHAGGVTHPLWSPTAWDLGGFAEVLGRSRTWRITGLTLTQAALGTAVSILLGLPGAYVLYRRTFPGRTLIRGLVTVPFVLPTVVVGVAFRALVNESGPLRALNLDGSFITIIAALAFFNYSVVVRTVGGFWQQLDPRPEQAARTLGASPTRVLWTVTLPALGPAIASAAALVFLFCATAFGTVLILGGTRYGTLETEIYIRTTQFLDLRAASVLSIVQLLIVAVVLWISAKARKNRERALALNTRDTDQQPLQPRDLRGATGIAIATTTVVVGGLLAWPLLNLVLRSLRTADGTWTLHNYRQLANPGTKSGLSISVWEATLNSLRTAAIAALIAIVIGTLIAYLAARRPRTPTGRRGLAILDAAFMLPLGVSAVTVGFGFLITLNKPLGLNIDLRTSGLLIPLAQAVVAIPLVVRTILPVLRAIDPRMREAAAALGAPPARVLATLDIPLAARSLGLAIGFAFAVSLGEFGATSFLARPDSATLPIVIFRLIGRPGPDNYAMALAAAVILATLTASIMLLAEQLRADKGGEI